MRQQQNEEPNGTRAYHSHTLMPPSRSAVKILLLVSQQTGFSSRLQMQMRLNGSHRRFHVVTPNMNLVLFSIEAKGLEEFFTSNSQTWAQKGGTIQLQCDISSGQILMYATALIPE